MYFSHAECWIRRVKAATLGEKSLKQPFMQETPRASEKWNVDAKEIWSGETQTLWDSYRWGTISRGRIRIIRDALPTG